MPDPLVAALVKLALTAGVVILVTRLVEVAGPLAAGIAVGLPIVIGPGYFFLLLEQPPEFVAMAAEASVGGLAGILAYLLASGAVAPRAGPTATIAAGSLAWAVVGGALALLHAPPAFSLAVFALLFVLGRKLRSGHEGLERPPALRMTAAVLAGRALPAGLLVALTTAVASTAGGRMAGFLLSFPIAVTVTCWIVHRTYGGRLAAATMAAAQTGILGLVGFLGILVLGVEGLGPMPAFALALVASLLPGLWLAFGRNGMRRRHT